MVINSYLRYKRTVNDKSDSDVFEVSLTFKTKLIHLSHGFSSSLKTDQRHSKRFPAFQPEPAGSRGERADHHLRRPLLLQRPGPHAQGRQAGTGALRTLSR